MGCEEKEKKMFGGKLTMLSLPGDEFIYDCFCLFTHVSFFKVY